MRGEILKTYVKRSFEQSEIRIIDNSRNTNISHGSHGYYMDEILLQKL